MTEELKDTLRLIIERVGNNYRVFIPMRDFSWHNNSNGQLMQLYKEGLVTKPVFRDNGVLVSDFTNMYELSLRKKRGEGG